MLKIKGSLTALSGAFCGEEKGLKTIDGIVHGALGGDGRYIAQLGLLVLIATPIARVIFSAIAFLRQRDFLYVLITLIVLSVLLYSVFFY